MCSSQLCWINFCSVQRCHISIASLKFLTKYIFLNITWYTVFSLLPTCPWLAYTYTVDTFGIRIFITNTIRASTAGSAILNNEQNSYDSLLPSYGQTTHIGVKRTLGSDQHLRTKVLWYVAYKCVFGLKVRCEVLGWIPKCVRPRSAGYHCQKCDKNWSLDFLVMKQYYDVKLFWYKISMSQGKNSLNTNMIVPIVAFLF